MISVTPKAFERINDLLAKEGKDSFLRLEIMGGGCAGFQYVFRLDTKRTPEDLSYGENEAFVIDSQSAQLIDGAVVDFVEDLMGASFIVKNPNAASSCGCGTSFSI